MYTRQHGNSQLISTENTEEIVRRALRTSMATPAPQRDIRDNQQEVNHNREEENGPDRDIPLLYVPDLANSILSEIIKDGIPVGNTGTQYIIPHTTTERFRGNRQTQSNTT